MRRPSEESDQIDKQQAVRRLARHLLDQNGFTGNVPQDLLEPFEIGEVAIHPGRAGGKPLVVRGSQSHKYLAYEG